MNSWTIVMFPKIQIDTSIAYFLLSNFGESKYPGIKNAKVEFWTEMPGNKTLEELEAEGYIFIDLGNSQFDHHRLGQDNKKISTAHMVAKYLGIEERPDLQKLLEFARRDDLEGKGTLSNDSIDRAFGLSGLLTSLNKALGSDSQGILHIIIPLLTSHLLEENKRHEIMPKEFEELKEQGKVRTFKAIQLGKQLKIVYVESDNAGMAGYLRSRAVGADLVIQKASTGHTNFVTRQQTGIKLGKLSRMIKLLEAERNNIVLPVDRLEELEHPGRTEKLPHWFYDARANTLQNGGLNPQGIPATKLTIEDIENAVKEGLNIQRENRNHQNNKISKGRGVVYID